MTAPDRPPGAPRSPSHPAERTGASDPERVLAQALRAMAGGGRQGRGEQASSGGSNRPPLTALQIVLIATILGLLIGITVGLLTLLV